ncbi:MAG: hypothetical protein O3C25_01135 [Chloroflexi bacterium]|nr:hypothetical protein [Chloroflexota bacterium]
MESPQRSCFFCEESRDTLAKAQGVFARLALDPTTTAATVERVRRRVGELELALRRHSCDAPRIPREAIPEPPPRLPVGRADAALIEQPARESA